MGWNGWNGVGWNGMEWDGMEWGEINLSEPRKAGEGP